MANDKSSGTDRASLWIRFLGEDLGGRPVPIHDLSLTMLAVQRLIYKAYLVREERLTRFAMPSDRVRTELALRLGDKRRESDAYSLFADPLFTAIVAPLIVNVLTALGKYLVSRNRRKTATAAVPPAITRSPLSVLSYPQVLSLTQRLDEGSGITGLEIYSDVRGSPRVKLDGNARAYVRELGARPFHGPPEVLEGQVKTLYYDDGSALVERDGAPSVKVSLPSKQFDTVRQEPAREAVIRFYGRPRWRLGTESLDYREFNAQRVEIAKPSRRDVEARRDLTP